jgi:hypothetical protein
MFYSRLPLIRRRGGTAMESSRLQSFHFSRLLRQSEGVRLRFLTLSALARMDAAYDISEGVSNALRRANSA